MVRLVESIENGPEAGGGAVVWSGLAWYGVVWICTV